jgi:15-cis-phytoene synthase
VVAFSDGKPVSTVPENASTHAFAHCQALVRAADKDRYLATLFAPAEHRGALFALYAFNIEIARVREVVREPLAGEIRLQWWSDVVAGQGVGDARGHPVAAALLATMERYRLPAELPAGMIAARRFDLYNDAMKTLAGLDDYGRKTSSALIELAACLFDHGGNPALAQLARHAGAAYAFAALLKAFPVHATRGQLYVPIELLDRHHVSREDVAARRASPGLRAAFAELRLIAREHLGEAERLSRDVPESSWPAFLPAALVKPLLDRMEAQASDPFKPVEIAQWQRQWRLWRAARRPERMFS